MSASQCAVCTTTPPIGYIPYTIYIPVGVPGTRSVLPLTASTIAASISSTRPVAENDESPSTNTDSVPRTSGRLAKRVKKTYYNSDFDSPESRLKRYLNRCNYLVPAVLKCIPRLLEEHPCAIFNLEKLRIAPCSFVNDPNSKRRIEQGVTTVSTESSGDILGYMNGLLIDYETWKRKYTSNEYVIKLTYFTYNGQCLYLVADPTRCIGAICNDASTLKNYSNNAVFYQDPSISNPLNPFLVQIKATQDINKGQWVHVDYGEAYTLPSVADV
jgi:hypothetical protein